VVEIILQPQSNTVVHPILVELIANAQLRLFGRGHAFQFTQDTFAVVYQRTRKQSLLVVQRDLVCAPRRGKHCDHDAKNRDRHNHADRNNNAKPRAVPTGLRALAGQPRTGLGHR